MRKVIFGQVGKLKAENVRYYKKLHSDSWRQVLKPISDCNIVNYNNFIKNDTVFAFFEYTGEDYNADMAKMAKCPVTQDWWSHSQLCDEKFVMNETDEININMEEIFCSNRV